MSLLKKINNKKYGGVDFASVNDNYTLLEDALKQIKHGGCSSYADVDSSYMLSDTKNIKGGGRMKKGGYDILSMGQNLLSQTKTILNNYDNTTPVKQSTLDNVSLPPSQQVQQAVSTTTQPVQQPASTATTQPSQQVSTATQPVQASVSSAEVKGGRNGGCNCGRMMKRGGALELAPFAAAVALLAARYMNDFNPEDIDDILSGNLSPKSILKSTPKSTLKSTPKSISSPKSTRKSKSS